MLNAVLLLFVPAPFPTVTENADSFGPFPAGTLA
jgi:hypothetical protein